MFSAVESSGWGWWMYSHYHDGKHREQGDELQGLAQHVRDGDVVAPVIIGIEGQDAAGQGIHHILAGRLHDNIPHKVGRERAVGSQKSRKVRELLFVRQAAKEQQIGDLFKAEALFGYEALYKLFDVQSAVVELSFTGDLLPVHGLVSLDLADLGKAGQNTLAVDIAQPALYVIFRIQLRIDLAGCLAHLGKL